MCVSERTYSSAIRCLLIFMGLFFALSIVSCQTKDEGISEGKKIKVITTLFPLYDFTKTIAGDKAVISLLLPPGVEAHSFEPKPGDILKINTADLFIYTGKYMEPWVENILKGVDNKKLLVVDASNGAVMLEGIEEDTHKHEHGTIDPHIWLDLSNAQKMVDTIFEGLIKKDPENKDFYLKNAEGYKTKLRELDRQYRETLSHCKKDIFIHGGHFAFNYLAKRYNLKYIAAYKGSPDAEPTPKRIIELKKKMKEQHIQTIYYEELIIPRVAQVIANETGATLMKLHGAHNISKEDVGKGVTFISIMEENLNSLKVGLQCQ